MADIAPVRSQIQDKDVAYRRSLSEAILTKVGAQSNFINQRQVDIIQWKLNGSYSASTDITFFDGVYSGFSNYEIVGMTVANGGAGSSGKSDYDLRWIDSSGIDQGTILSTKASINSTASANTIGIRNLATGNDVSPTGVTLPVFSKTTFLEGESIYFVLTDAMVSAFNTTVTLWIRPIN